MSPNRSAGIGIRRAGRQGRMTAEGGSANYDFSCNLEVDYGSEDNARIVYNALAVDKELRPSKVRRQISIAADGKLSVRFEAVEARLLRASYSAFIDILGLASKTIEEFSTPLKG